MATHVALELQSLGVVCEMPSFAKQEATIQSMRAASNIQPRKGLPPLVPEFKQVHSQLTTESLPDNSRKLSAPRPGYIASANKEGQITVGVHYSPDEFVKEAMKLIHPSQQQSIFPKQMRDTVESVTSSHVRVPNGLVQNGRGEKMDKSEQEKRGKSRRRDRIREVLHDKRLCLFEQLPNDAGHEDSGLVADLKKGFDLTSTLPASGTFKHKFRPASMSCPGLRKVADLSRNVFLESVQSSGNTELDASLYEATLKEVEKGFIVGPVDPAELPPGSTLTKRFPVRQNKVRPIDDYKAPVKSLCRRQELAF